MDLVDSSLTARGLFGVVREAGQLHLDHLVSGGVHHGQGGFEVTQDQIPPARIGVAETVLEGAVGAGYRRQIGRASCRERV